jgi:hypothetical protein
MNVYESDRCYDPAAAEHHDMKSKVWLEFYNRQSGRLYIAYDDAIDEACASAGSIASSSVSKTSGIPASSAAEASQPVVDCQSPTVSVA